MSYRQYDHVSNDAQTALTEFLTEFMNALVAAPEPWARKFGAGRNTRAITTKWPIPLTAANYQEMNGDPRYRTLGHKTIELIKKIWQDGIAELLGNVEAPDFFGWGEEPQNMALALMAHPNKLIAAALAAGTSSLSFDGVAFFSDSHPYNVLKTGLGTFDNLHTSQAVSASSLEAAKIRFRQRKSASGESMGLRLTHIFTPAALEEQWRSVLDQKIVLVDSGVNDAAAAVDNRHQGTVELVVADELTEDGVWYPAALNKPGAKPWALVEGARKDMILGTSSALYESEDKVGFDSRVEMVGGLILPHTIERCVTT